MMTGLRYFALVLCVALIEAITAHAQQNTDALAGLVSDLGKCESTLGSLRQLQAGAIKGDVLDLQAIKAKIEKANPTLIFDLKTFTVKLKPDEKTPDKKIEKPQQDSF